MKEKVLIVEDYALGPGLAEGCRETPPRAAPVTKGVAGPEVGCCAHSAGVLRTERAGDRLSRTWNDVP